MPPGLSGPCTNGRFASYEWSIVRSAEPIPRMAPSAFAPDRLAQRDLSVFGPVAAVLPLVAACFLLAVGTMCPANAQGVQIGVRIGPTFGFLNDSAVPFASRDPEINANPRLDLHVGAYVIVPVSDHFALQPELLYVQKGGHFSRPRSQSYAVERYRLSYVQGELLGRRDVPIPSPLSLHAVAGLSVDAALEGILRRNFRSTETDFAERVALLNTGQMRRWDVGLVVGVGLGYPVGGAGRLALELRYNPGFRNVFFGSTPPAARPPGASDELFPLPDTYSALRHDVVTASLTYTMPIGR